MFSLWAVAALISSPVIAEWFVHRIGGTGMSHDALRPSASVIREVPMPPDERLPLLNSAGAAFEGAQLTSAGHQRLRKLNESSRLIHKAFGVDQTESDRLWNWWLDRLPKARSVASLA